MPSLIPEASIMVGYPITSKDIPRHPLSCWFKATVNCVAMLRLFDKGGSRVASQALKDIQVTKGLPQNVPTEVLKLKAREDAAALRSLSRLIYGTRACFAESFAICSGLRCFGYNSCVVVGYARVELFAPTSMHAWVEYENEPISDAAEVKYAYLEVCRYS